MGEVTNVTELCKCGHEYRDHSKGTTCLAYVCEECARFCDCDKYAFAGEGLEMANSRKDEITTMLAVLQAENERLKGERDELKAECVESAEEVQRLLKESMQAQRERDAQVQRSKELDGMLQVRSIEVANEEKMTDAMETRISTLTAERDALRTALGMMYDKWENGIACQEADEDGDCSDGTNIGNAFRLTLEEEQTVLNLIVEKAEEHEESCANCGKPYRAHLLHDRNRCSPWAESTFFPSSIANAVQRRAALIPSASPQPEQEKP